MYEAVRVISLNSFEKVLCITGSGNSDAGKAYQDLMSFFDKAQTGLPQFLRTETANGHHRFHLTGPSEILSAITHSLKSQQMWTLEKTLSAVTATCTGSVAPELIGQFMTKLAAAGIHYESIQNTSMGLTIYLDEKDRTKAIEKLHP